MDTFSKNAMISSYFIFFIVINHVFFFNAVEFKVYLEKYIYLFRVILQLY